MPTNTLLPDAKRLQLDCLRWDGVRAEMLVSSISPTAACPQCGQPSGRVHSHYQRRLQDLPWQGITLQIEWRNRRFFCENPCCSQRIFTERLPEVAAPYARMTTRFVAALRALAIACGGEVGARLAQRLGMRSSPDTLLREIRRSCKERSVQVRVLGVDDWALRRGQVYGTILVDLESHQVIDLLPERSPESFAAWLSKHAEVEIIARDRGEQYSQGAAQGAPQAVQVADRWHLLHNLHDALVRVIERFPRELRDTARQAATPTPPESPRPPPLDPVAPPPSEPTAFPRSPRWQEKYERLLELQRKNYSQRALARALGLDRSTVQRWIKAGGLPSLPARGGGRRSGLAKWHEYLEARWQAGCHNATALTAELQAQGYRGSYYPVRRWVARWRSHSVPGSSATPSAPRAPSAKAVAWWYFKSAADRDADQQRFLDLFTTTCPLAAQAASLAINLHDLMRKRDLTNLADWLRSAAAPESPIEMRRFAKSLQSDLSAVQAAFSLPWSNGQTEGQVNRLKLIKRQMFGRAKFDLLRQRVLAA